MVKANLHPAALGDGELQRHELKKRCRESEDSGLSLGCGNMWVVGFSFLFFFFLSFEHQPHEEEEETRPRSTLVSKQKLRGRGGFGGRRLAAPWTCSGARWDPDPKPLWAAPGLIPQDPQTRLGCIWADPTRCPPPIPMGRLSPCGELWGKGALSSPHLPTGAWPAAAQRADFYFIF